MSIEGNLNRSKKLMMIYGLLGQYYFEIDLDKPLSVLVGENGSGKSTILNIIKCVSEKNFVNLSHYIFEKIIIVQEAETFEIHFTDLIPKPQSIINHLVGELILDMKNEDFHQIIHEFEKLLKSHPMHYALFMSKCFHDEPISGYLKLLIPEICLNKSTPGLDYKSEYKKSLERLINTSSDIMCFRGSKIYEKANAFIDFYRDSFFSKHKALSVDLIHNVLLNDEALSAPICNSTKLFHLNQLIEKYCEDKMKLHPLGEKPKFDEFFANQNLIQMYKNEFNPLIKDLNEKIEIELSTADEMVLKIAQSLNKTKTVDVNEILSRFYYSDDFIVQMNSIAGMQMAQTLGHTPKLITLDQDFFTNEVRNEIETYFYPIFPKNSLMGQVVVQIIFKFMMDDFNELQINAFKAFYLKYYEEFKQKKSQKIIRFETIMNSFLSNKHISVRPSGLDIVVEHYISKNISKFDLITQDFNQIRAMDLSSGERKLMLIFLISIFFEDALLLIDEPELSLSILWQEELIEKMTENAMSQHVIVATHSPFIINKEIIENSVISLPLEL